MIKAMPADILVTVLFVLEIRALTRHAGFKQS